MTVEKTIVLITGANSGVGYALSKALVAQPQYHVILACRSAAKANQTKDDLTSLAETQGQLSIVHFDSMDDASIETAARQVEQDFGRLDILVNNAGIVSQAETAGQRWRESLAVNVTGPAVATDAFKPLLLKSRAPRVIYVTSRLGSLACCADKGDINYRRDAAEYRACKAALNMLALCQSKTLGAEGIKVFATCPGFVMSNLLGSDEAVLEMRRKMGALSPETSAAFIKSVIEGERDEFVGQAINVDGPIPW